MEMSNKIKKDNSQNKTFFFFARCEIKKDYTYSVKHICFNDFML